MELRCAKQLLQTLSDGINPVTGEVLPPEDSANQGEVIRALYTVLNALERAEKENSQYVPPNAGKPWSSIDDAKLCGMFDNGATQTEMSNYFKRSKGSIAARLVKLGKISKREELADK